MEVSQQSSSKGSIGLHQCAREEHQCMEGGNFWRLLSTPPPPSSSRKNSATQCCCRWTRQERSIGRWCRDTASPVPAKAPSVTVKSWVQLRYVVFWSTTSRYCVMWLSSARVDGAPGQLARPSGPNQYSIVHCPTPQILYSILCCRNGYTAY